MLAVPGIWFFLLWSSPNGGAFYLFDGIWGWAPLQTFELYVVDVGGQRLVIDAFHDRARRRTTLPRSRPSWARSRSSRDVTT